MLLSNFKFQLLILFACTLLMAACCSPHEQNSEAEAIINKMITESEIPGLTVSVSVKGDLIWSKGFGWANIEQQVAADPANTKFRIGSISKPLSAAALGVLMEEGKVDIDRPVQEYVPSFPEKRWTLTTRQAGGHTAGIRHYRGDEFLSSKRYTSVIEGLEIFQNDTLLFEPGTNYSYSSYGFNLLSAVVEKAAEMDFLNYMAKVVFDPIGMDNTTADYMDSLIIYRAGCYAMADGKMINAPYVDNSYKWAGGGFLSTSEDLVKFGNAMLTNKLFSEATQHELISTQKLSTGKETGYGIGWFIATNSHGRNYYGHGGGSVGGISSLVIIPEYELVIAITTNDSRANLNGIHDLAELFIE